MIYDLLWGSPGRETRSVVGSGVPSDGVYKELVGELETWLMKYQEIIHTENVKDIHKCLKIFSHFNRVQKICNNYFEKKHK